MRPFHLTIFLALVATASAGTHHSCTCNSAVGPEADPTTLNNAAQQILSIAITLLSDAPAIPHQLALTTGAMFEALLIARGRPQLTSVDVTLGELSEDRAVGYAGFGALSRAFASNPEKTAALDAAAAQIGLVRSSVLTNFGIPIAAAVAMKYPLSIPPEPYTPPNPPSASSDARCGNIVDPDGWQPLCLTPPTGGPCQVQMVPFLPLVNASLITADGERNVAELIKNVPSPNTFTSPLPTFPDSNTDFTADYRRVLRASRWLNDQRKIVAEVFAPNAVLGVQRLALDEAAVRHLDLESSVRLFFAVSAATRDAFIGSSTVKVIFSTIRPITVFQCGFRGQTIRTWRGPHQGVGRIMSNTKNQFRAYIQTPPFPGYISGHTTIAGAATRVLDRLLGSRPQGANCFIRPAGTSVIEGRKEEGEDGFIPGVTDVPNSGRLTVGFTPASETTVCWSSFREYASMLSRSRLFGGVHTPLENRLGLRLGRRAGNRAVNLVEGLLPL